MSLAAVVAGAAAGDDRDQGDRSEKQARPSPGALMRATPQAPPLESRESLEAVAGTKQAVFLEIGALEPISGSVAVDLGSDGSVHRLRSRSVAEELDARVVAEGAGIPISRLPLCGPGHELLSRIEYLIEPAGAGDATENVWLHVRSENAPQLCLLRGWVSPWVDPRAGRRP